MTPVTDKLLLSLNGMISKIRACRATVKISVADGDGREFMRDEALLKLRIERFKDKLNGFELEALRREAFRTLKTFQDAVEISDAQIDEQVNEMIEQHFTAEHEWLAENRDESRRGCS